MQATIFALAQSDIRFIRAVLTRARLEVIIRHGKAVAFSEGYKSNGFFVIIMQECNYVSQT